jgi:hypothetical protein
VIGLGEAVNRMMLRCIDVCGPFEWGSPMSV